MELGTCQRPALVVGRDRFCFSPRHVGEQLFRVVDDALLYRVPDAADPLRFARLVVETQRARAVQHLQVLQRVLIDDQEIGQAVNIS